MKISKFSHKSQTFVSEEKKINGETIAYNFSGAKWNCGLRTTCCPPFLCKAAAPKGFRECQVQLSHTRYSHIICYLSIVASCFQFTDHSLLGTLGVNITCLKIQYANHKHCCALISPWCGHLTWSRGQNISIISMLVDTSVESLITENLDMLKVFFPQTSHTFSVDAAELLCADIW